VVVFAGQGDPRRSMALLWRDPDAEAGRSPGPKPGLSLDMIVDAAIIVADEQGMEALSMRAVGERLGRTGMALYTYVPGKRELVDLMYDRALAELPTDYDLSAGWRVAVMAWVDDLWSFFLRHPWVLQVSQARPVLGPHEFVVGETLASILAATGLEVGVQRRIFGTLFHVVRGAAQTAVESHLAVQATDVSEEQWWYARSAMLAQVAPDFAERFPQFTRLHADTAEPVADDTMQYVEREAWQTLEVGLAVLLDGIEATVAAASGAARRRAAQSAD
jgi:AcrR family transcriptional regulator